MRRVFIGLELPESTRKACEVLMQEMRPAFPPKSTAWVRPENLHLTLKFLGETDDSRVEAITDGLSRVADGTAPSKISARSIVSFSGRILAVELSDNGNAIRDLAGEIDALCSSNGFAKEMRPFRPHITLARGRGRTTPFKSRLPNPELAIPGWTAGDVTLFESVLHPEGSIYTALARFPFGR